MRVADQRVLLDIQESGTKTSPMLRVHQMHGFSIVAAWEAAAGRTGTLRLEVSNNAHLGYRCTTTQDTFERENGENPDAVWVPLLGSDKVIGAGAETHAWNVAQAFYASVRIVLVGTGAGAEDILVGHFHAQGYNS